jgi:hypothetical protein
MHIVPSVYDVAAIAGACLHEDVMAGGGMYQCQYQTVPPRLPKAHYTVLYNTMCQLTAKASLALAATRTTSHWQVCACLCLPDTR